MLCVPSIEKKGYITCASASTYSSWIIFEARMDEFAWFYINDYGEECFISLLLVAFLLLNIPLYNVYVVFNAIQWNFFKLAK